MITRALGIEADEALNGTTVINTLALLEGAAILRVHDVAAARQAVDLTELTIGPAPLYSTIS
jgi:dihydropteroate synthase